MPALLLITLLADPLHVEWTALPDCQILDVECAGDINGDGTYDVFAADDGSSAYGIVCLDGLTGSVIWSNDSIGGIRDTECLRATGDANLDGIDDLAFSTASDNSVVLLSGATGAVLWSEPQSHPVVYVQQSRGPSPGDVVVLGTKDMPGTNHDFFALDSQGSPLWSSPGAGTMVSYIKVTDSDVNGNGWSEMGYSINRGSVMSGSVAAKDGFTGDLIQGCGTCYYGTLDICDSPIASIAVSNWGNYPVMWVNHLLSGDTIWSSNDENMSFTNICFTPNITGPSSPVSEIVGWYGSEMTLIRGDDGFYQDSYQFPGSIQSFDFFWDDSVCRIAVVTSSTLCCPDLVFSSPSYEPSVSLPGPGGCNLCLLESSLYPTPLAAVAMNGSGWGVCAISTSWPVSLPEHVASTVTNPVRLVSNPGTGGITLQIEETPLNAHVIDITGRMVHRIKQTEPAILFVPLPAGVYHIIEQDTDCPILRAVVLP
jgi:hypothetical protein